MSEGYPPLSLTNLFISKNLIICNIFIYTCSTLKHGFIPTCFLVECEGNLFHLSDPAIGLGWHARHTSLGAIEKGWVERTDFIFEDIQYAKIMSGREGLRGNGSETLCHGSEAHLEPTCSTDIGRDMLDVQYRNELVAERERAKSVRA
ncbi:hypothetical protein HG530_003499 [Fusarium avenaceum]|nr:hypothetical protein HG530_003499 [Fusarium avenaceum]